MGGGCRAGNQNCDLATRRPGLWEAGWTGEGMRSSELQHLLRFVIFLWRNP